MKKKRVETQDVYGDVPSDPFNERFLVPPFTVLDARSGWWQRRKRMWLGLGIQSELGRGDNLLRLSEQTRLARALGISYDEARRIVAEKRAQEKVAAGNLPAVRSTKTRKSK